MVSPARLAEKCICASIRPDAPRLTLEPVPAPTQIAQVVFFFLLLHNDATAAAAPKNIESMVILDIALLKKTQRETWEGTFGHNAPGQQGAEQSWDHA